MLGRGGVRNDRSQTDMLPCVWCGVGLVGCGESDKCSGTGIVLHVLSG